LIPDLDIYRAVKLIIGHHGDESALYAAGRADLLLRKATLFFKLGTLAARYPSGYRKAAEYAMQVWFSHNSIRNGKEPPDILKHA